MIHDLSQSYILSQHEIIINFLNIPQEMSLQKISFLGG